MHGGFRADARPHSSSSRYIPLCKAPNPYRVANSYMMESPLTDLTVLSMADAGELTSSRRRPGPVTNSPIYGSQLTCNAFFKHRRKISCERLVITRQRATHRSRVYVICSETSPHRRRQSGLSVQFRREAKSWRVEHGDENSSNTASRLLGCIAKGRCIAAYTRMDAALISEGICVTRNAQRAQ